MTISSRIPEGTPNCCPVCGGAVRIDPSVPLGDAPCPACGTLLWYVVGETQVRLFNPQDGGLIDFIAELFGISPEAVRAGRLDEFGLESLDMVELVMKLEESP
ncbi:MAG: phosphopantetheine-binding protein [Planctomycetaceae bacterium]|nr:phosphopantetheine-binding protein [Planctomycetaceae bacterium]